MKLTATQLKAYHRDPVRLIAEQLVLEDGQRFGDVMAPFQRQFFEAVFANHKDGRPVHRLVYDERRRGESKTADCAAAALADLLVGPAGHRSYAVAGDQDQAELILDSVRTFKDRSPMLEDVTIQKSTVINRATDSRLRVMSSDDRTAYGIRPRKTWFDELSLQPDSRLWTSMWSSVGKNPKSQLIAVSMAGWDMTSIGWTVREMARTTEGYYFATRAGSELAPWLSAADMAEQERTLHPADFARFWECRWVEPAGSWISAAMYDACVTGQEARHAATGQISVGFIDVGLVHDPTAIAVGHREVGLIVIDTVRTLQGSRSEPVELEVLEDLVAELTQKFSVRTWRLEAPQAVASQQRLQRRLCGVHVEVRYPTAQTQANLFGTLYSLFNEKRLVLFPHDQLRREALNLVTRVQGGRLKVVDSTSIHQDHVIAVGGVAELLQSQPLMQAGEVDRFKTLMQDMRPPGSKSPFADTVGVPGMVRYPLSRLDR